MVDKTTVQRKSNGQVVVTIPRGIAEGMELVGEEVAWSIESRDRVSLKATRTNE